MHTYTATGNYIAIVTTTNSINAMTATTMVTITSSGQLNQTMLVISNSSGGSLVAPNGSVTVTFPPGAVSGTTTITYTQLTSPTQFTGALKFLGHAFTLVAANQSGNPVTQFSNVFTLTLHYADSDWVNAGVANESLLNLYYWSGNLRLAIPASVPAARVCDALGFSYPPTPTSNGWRPKVCGRGWWGSASFR